MGTLKLECVWQHRFQTLAEASEAIHAYVRHYNHTRPHSRLGYVSPSAWRAQNEADLSSQSVQL
jgi:putative transposase